MLQRHLVTLWFTSSIKGEPDITCCENPFYDCEYDVVRYIKEWKEDFLRSTVEQQLKEVDEKHAKI